jgi:hypothetical protein
LASSTDGSLICFDRQKSTISPLINADNTDLQKQKTDAEVPTIGETVQKKKTDKAGCGRPERVNLSYQFESKFRNFLGKSRYTLTWQIGDTLKIFILKELRFSPALWQ